MEPLIVLTDNRWHGLQPGVSREPELLAHLGEPESRHEGVGYAALQGLTLWAYPASALSCYLHDQRLLLLAAGPNRGNRLQPLAAPWTEALGRVENSRMLPSRVDKNARVHLYLSRGMALHIQGERLELLELFPPIAEANYLQQLYVEPAPFTK